MILEQYGILLLTAFFVPSPKNVKKVEPKLLAFLVLLLLLIFTISLLLSLVKLSFPLLENRYFFEILSFLFLKLMCIYIFSKNNIS